MYRRHPRGITGDTTLTVKMMQPPEAAAPPPGRPAVQPLYRPSLNWPMQLYSYFPASELISHLSLAMGATMLALKLSGETLSGNSDTALDGTTAGWWYIAGIDETVAARRFLSSILTSMCLLSERIQKTKNEPVRIFDKHVVSFNGRQP